MGFFKTPHVTPLTSLLMCAVLPDETQQQQLTAAFRALRFGVRELLRFYSALLDAPSAPIMASPRQEQELPWTLWTPEADGK